MSLRSEFIESLTKRLGRKPTDDEVDKMANGAGLLLFEEERQSKNRLAREAIESDPAYHEYLNNRDEE